VFHASFFRCISIRNNFKRSRRSSSEEFKTGVIDIAMPDEESFDGVGLDLS